MHGAKHEDGGYHQQDKRGILVLVLVEPTSRLALCRIAERQHGAVHPVHSLLGKGAPHLLRPDEIIAHVDGVGLVFLVYRQ